MNNIQTLRSLKQINNRSLKQNKWGNIHHVIGGFMIFSSILGVIAALLNFRTDLKFGIYSLLIDLIIGGIFLLEFIHGSNLKHKSRKNTMKFNQLKRMIQNEDLPVYYYNNGNNMVHTHFTFTLPFLTEIILDNGLLKMKSDRLSMRNKEIVIKINTITNINFKDTSLLNPGYLNLIINGQSDFNPTTSTNSIVFFNDGKDYILELKDYLEYSINQQNSSYWR